MSNTLNYYDQNADAFISGTLHADVTDLQDEFLALLPAGGCVLDFGCGSGRDSKYFMEKGFAVEACDGSEALCRFARQYTGLSVRQMLFQELSAKECYDGIWACSSILHLDKGALSEVFEKMAAALKTGGVLYTSFKYGTFSGERHGRFFTDFTQESFAVFLKPAWGLAIEQEWITTDVRPGREDVKWLNLILRKQ